MNRSIRKRICWLAVGLVLSLGAGPMAYADDTDLFIANADPQVTGALPNILFVIDTSGSMTSKVFTQSAWDTNLTFSGCYRSDAIYFSVTGVQPGCGSNNWIRKTANYCAASQQPLAAFGRYDDNMLAWRNRSGTNNDRWELIDPNRRSQPLECQADAGIHGNGGGATYAADGSAGPWANSDAAEPAWNQDYAIWDGNWLNWFVSDGTVETTRIDVVKDVATNLIQNVEGVNVGLMRFSRNNDNSEGGGPVLRDLAPVSTSRQDMIDTINNLPADGWTPLSETLYEAGQYFAGRSVFFGNQGNPKSVAASRVGNTITSNQYESPLEFQCQKNYVVFLTDGEPTRDTAADNLIPALPGFADVNTTGGSCDLNGSNGQGHCLDDMAEYMYKADMNPNLDGIQNVTTYTIGFTVDLPLLASTAARGGGEYRLADDTSSLAKVLTDIVSSILKQSTTFTAPAVPVNAFNRTQNLRDVYVSVFEPSGHAHWPGNLKKYRIENGQLVGQNSQPAVNPDTGFFWSDGANQAFSFWSASPDGDRVREGGAANEQPAWTQRKIYTNVTDDENLLLAQDMKNRIEVFNSDLDPANFGMDAGSEAVVNGLGLGLSEFDKVIAWTLGLDVWELTENPSGGQQPRNAMGDPLHVRPVAVIYGGTEANPDSVIFTATNDGMLHAVDADDGSELWGFVPKRLLPRLEELYNDPLVANKRYGLDGDIRAYIVNNDNMPGVNGAERVFLVFGMRRGGDGLFAIEVTDRNNPRLAWELNSDSSGMSNLGQTWSTPAITKVNVDGDVKNVVIIGGGYDDGQDNPGYRTDTVGNAIYMIDLLTGDLLWSAGADGSHNLTLDGNNGTAAMEHSIPAPVKVVDLSGDGLADRMYAGDMGGRLWRFDIINGEKDDDLVEGGLFATLGAADIASPTAADVRRFYAAPDVVAVLDQPYPYLAVNVGSGYRASPLETATQDEFFSVRDYDFTSVILRDEYPAPITRDQLVNVTTFSGAAYPELQKPVDKGWLITMVESAGEKILTESITFNGVTFFTSFSPGNPGAVCETSAGTNRVYRVSVRDGRPLPPDGPLPPDDPEPKDRITTLKQGGIAPETILLFPGDEEPTACSGVECFDPGFDTGATRTYWYQDETQ